MRKRSSNVCKLRPFLATESTNSARMRTIVTAGMQRHYSQMELIFWITLVLWGVRVRIWNKTQDGPDIFSRYYSVLPDKFWSRNSIIPRRPHLKSLTNHPHIDSVQPEILIKP
jgi:hypothetical protein